MKNDTSKEKKESVKVIKTDENAIDGQDKCPKCGATEISLNINTGMLRCEFCRHEFKPVKADFLENDISKQKGITIGSGATDIKKDDKGIITLKCSSCGAEVVIDIENKTQSRCHWCRNILSINNQVPNGAIPDVILPFAIKKEEAKNLISDFVKERKFFANPKFKKEFTLDNIMGVYFPYMIIDVNAHALLIGEAEHTTRSYRRKVGDHYVTYYDADLYDVEREFDIIINDLTVESSSDKLNTKAKDKTTNIINSIMPFDTENCVKFNSNYLKGFSSEKRDVNVDTLKKLVNLQSEDITVFKANDTLMQYDRGVCWSNKKIDVKGQNWLAAYLPVWLYSYQQIKNNKKILHYVAVNARTKEVMGSVPIHMPKLLMISSLVEILGLFLTILADFDYDFIFLLSGIIYFIIIYSRYRNQDARHTYERETKTETSNMIKKDEFIKSKKGLTSTKIEGANNKSIHNENIVNEIMDTLNKL